MFSPLRCPAFCLAILLLLPGGIGFCQSDASYREALRQLREKRYSQGLKAYYKFLLICDPLFGVQTRRNDLAPVIDFLDKSLEERVSDTPRNMTSSVTFSGDSRGSPGPRPGDPSWRLLKVILERILLEWPEAECGLDTLIRAHPGNPFLEFLRGEFFLAQDRIEEAVTAFRKLEGNPRATSLIKIAKALMTRRGIDSDAVARRAGLMRMALRHIDLLERVEGEKILLVLLREFPRDIDASRTLVDLLLEMNRLGDAKNALDHLKTIAGPAAVPPFQEARLLFHMGKYAEVVEILSAEEETLEEYSIFFLAESMFQTGDFAGSLFRFGKLLENDPQNTGFLLRQAACHEALGQVADAAELLSKFSAAQPDSAILLIEQAGFLERLGRREEALEKFHAASAIAGPLQVEAQERYQQLSSVIEEEKRVEAEIAARSERQPPNEPVPEISPPPDSPQDRKASFDRLANRQAELGKRLKRLYD